MTIVDTRRFALLGLALAFVSFAPAQEVKAPKSSALAEARYKAALKQYEEVWTYYRQSRTDTFYTYYWSRLTLESQQELCVTKGDRIDSLKAHQERMKRLQSLLQKVKKLGFARTIDLGASDYYLLEVEHWLEKAGAE